MCAIRHGRTESPPYPVQSHLTTTQQPHHDRRPWFNAGTYIVIASLIVERRLARPWGGIRACALKVLTRYVIKCIFGGGVVVVVD